MHNSGNYYAVNMYFMYINIYIKIYKYIISDNYFIDIIFQLYNKMIDTIIFTITVTKVH